MSSRYGRISEADESAVAPGKLVDELTSILARRNR